MLSNRIGTSLKDLHLRHCNIGSLFVVTSLLLACNSGQHISSAEAAASTGQTWSIVLQLSGGFAGINQKILLDNSGILTTINNKSGKQRSARADTRLMAYAGEWVKARPVATTTQPVENLPIGCADCINYNINIVTNGRRYNYRFNTLSLKSSPYRDLVSRLTAAAQQLNRANKTH